MNICKVLYVWAGRSTGAIKRLGNDTCFPFATPTSCKGTRRAQGLTNLSVALGQDERFNHDVDLMTGYHTRSMLCLPIKDSNGEVIGVAQVINKLGEADATFSAHDSRVFASYLQFCGIGLKNAQLYERSQLEIKRNQVGSSDP